MALEAFILNELDIVPARSLVLDNFYQLLMLTDWLRRFLR